MNKYIVNVVVGPCHEVRMTPQCVGLAHVQLGIDAILEIFKVARNILFIPLVSLGPRKDSEGTSFLWFAKI